VAALSTREINDLPDSAFAYIEPGGEKDDEGKTVPRSLRHFPIHDAAHVRNALARLSQSPFGAKARAKVLAAAKKFGIEVSDDEKRAVTVDDTGRHHYGKGSSKGGQFALKGASDATAAATKAAKKSAAATKKKIASSGSTKTSAGLRRGARGEKVKQLQRLLKELGFDLGKFGPNKDGIDGVLGARTEAAIRAAQKRLGLPQTGVATGSFLSKLRDAVERDRAKKGKQTTGKAKSSTQSMGSKSGLSRGDSGNDVRELQRLLSALGVKVNANGTYDAATENAVKEIQRKLGIKRPTGKASRTLINKMLAAHDLSPCIDKSKTGSYSALRSEFLDEYEERIGAPAFIPSERLGDTEEPEFRRDVGVSDRTYDFEIRAASRDGRRLVGTVAVFNKRTRIPDRNGDFEEEVHPGFAARSLRELGMPVMQFDHGKDPRTGTVPIGIFEHWEETRTGYEVEGPLFDNPVVEPIRQAIAAGAIKGMSFRFLAKNDKWERRHGDLDLRHVFDADVPEAGPVVFPAYRDTAVTVRALIEQRPDELRELEALATDLTGRPSARSAGGGDSGADAPPIPNHLQQRELLLRAKGVIL